MKKIAMIIILLSSPLYAQSYIGASGHVIPQFYASPGGSLQYSFVDFGGFITAEICGIDRAAQYHITPLSEFSEGDFNAFSYVVAPVGWEFILSTSYRYSIASWLSLGPIVGVAARSEQSLVQAHYIYTTGPLHNPNGTSETTETFEGAYTGGNNPTPTTTFVPNFGAAIKIGPFVLEYATESGIGFGFEIPLFNTLSQSN